jgi:hypothetical protein
MLLNGCHGSAVTAQGASETCRACPERVECFAAVQRNAGATIDRAMTRLAIRKVDEEDREKIAARLHSYFGKAMTLPRLTPLRKMTRVDGLRLKCAENGTRIAAIAERQNPFEEDRDGPLYQMAKFVCEGVPFTPKDMAEYLYDTGCTLKKSSAMSEISRFVGLLVEDGILERKERHVLCLA